jgi:ketosteroid isomerase-like protein
MNKRFATALAALILVTGCGGQAENPAAEGEALMKISRDWSTLVGKGDMKAALDVWAKDAVVMPPGMAVFEGRDSIREYVEKASQMPGFKISWEPVSVHVSDCGDMAYMIERNVITVNDSLGNPVTTHGKVVTVWKKESGEWKNVVDIWNDALQLEE